LRPHLVVDVAALGFSGPHSQSTQMPFGPMRCLALVMPQSEHSFVLAARRVHRQPPHFGQKSRLHSGHG
jgi:hypothetical protein